MTSGYANLARMLEAADATDRAEGLMAYDRYNEMMQRIAIHHARPVERVTAAFVALSPNSDYHGNLRSLITMLLARDPREATVSTYKHCRERAARYLLGEEFFLSRAKGPKTRNFYLNILDPLEPNHVTIDGHMHAAWLGDDTLTMRDAVVSPAKYDKIANDLRRLARRNSLRANQAQAILWFTRKRLLRIKSDPQSDLFRQGDQNRTLIPVADIRPYS